MARAKQLLKIGDTIKVVKGPLAGRTGEISSLNRNHYDPRIIWVGIRFPNGDVAGAFKGSVQRVEPAAASGGDEMSR